MDTCTSYEERATDICTSYEERVIAIVREEGYLVATGQADVTVYCSDFIGDQENRHLHRLKLLEILLPTDHPRFSYWNSWIGRDYPVKRRWK